MLSLGYALGTVLELVLVAVVLLARELYQGVPLEFKK